MRTSRWCRAVTLRMISALILTILVAVPTLAAELRLTIAGVRSDKGEILIALYDNADGFKSAIVNGPTRGLLPDRGRLIGTAIRAQLGTQSTIFTQLPPGRYAIIVIHDENDNGRIDQNGMGVPTEGYGFGNNAQGFMSAPAFDAAAITIGDASLSTSITLIYPRALSAEDWMDFNSFIGRSPSEPSQ